MAKVASAQGHSHTNRGERQYRLIPAKSSARRGQTSLKGMKMNVLVCGGRDYQDRDRAMAVLDALPRTDLTIICGGANGADKLAADWALWRGVGLEWFPAEWRKHGKAAGPIRNQKMIDEGKPDLCIAFPGGRGTADMVRRAQAAGVEVRQIS